MATHPCQPLAVVFHFLEQPALPITPKNFDNTTPHYPAKIFRGYVFCYFRSRSNAFTGVEALLFFIVPA